jgi:ATP-dependent exoDNAse (exonuclease V) beta subunit
MGRLQLGTIDSFFARILGAFPYELGLTRPHRIMDEIEQNMARRQAMEHLLAAGDDDRENRVLQMYKQLTWGVEGKNVYRVFEEHLRDYHDLFLENRDPTQWGSPADIFGKSPWWYGKDEDFQKLLLLIEKELDALGMKPAMAKGFRALLIKLEAWQPGLDVVKSTLWDALLVAREDLRNGSAEIKYNRTVLDIEDPLSDLLYRLLQQFVRQEIFRKIGITQSIGQLLAEYDELYDRSIREAGSLVFADFPMLLVKGLCADSPVFDPSDIVYRLDAKTDHWMMDEFQDTSRIQWKVLSAFIDEILQDPSGRRTFFYVGDVKQSIYGWRGGDARLFQEIFQHYNQGEPGIRKSVLNQSWRSVPAVLDCVNTLFGERLTSSLIGASAKARWEESWSEHVPSPDTKDLPGYAGWGLVEDKEDLATACIDLIKSVDPISKGLSCAILVRTNAGMEGVVNIARDNIVGTWVLAFLYSLARPDEDFPRAYLSLQGMELDTKEYRRLAGLIRTVLTEEGYAEAVRRLLSYLDAIISREPFLIRRGEQILEAATRFESTSMEGLESFIRFLEETTVKEASLTSQVQVMTVHKAKGLGFDVVIVAGFGGSPITGSRNESIHVERMASGEVDWILDLPRKMVYEQDPVLRKAHQQYEDDQTFEALCLLYVAMTRAKRGLYCLGAVPARNSKALTWQQLFEATFGLSAETREEGQIKWQKEWGDTEWFASIPPPETKEVKPVQLDAIPGALPEQRPMLRKMASPSQEAHGDESVVRSLRSNAGRQFCSRMHDFLATVEWIEFDEIGEVNELIATLDGDIASRFKDLLETGAGKAVFSRPEQPCHLWREKPYVLRKGDSIAQGIIDRAVVYLDGEGKPERVEILDYKTDTLDPDRPAEEQLQERYATQLERYREAVSILMNLPETAITTRLIPV